MLSLPSLPSFLRTFTTSSPSSSSKPHTPIPLPPVTIHNISTAKDKPSRTLKHLLKLNHANHAILFHARQYHNHLPHHLGSAYLLKAAPEHLEAIYEADRDLERWEDSPGEVSRHDWRDYLGKKEYERAFVDFFEDELVEAGYVWWDVVRRYLFEENQAAGGAVGGNLIGGLCHPLIHLAYAVELDSKEVAMEALSMAAVCYNFLHVYLDEERYTRPSAKPSTDLLVLLELVRADTALSFPGSDSMQKLFSSREDKMMEYWNAWDLADPVKQFENSQRTAAALLCATGPFDFFFVHSLTASHAVRILLPVVPTEWHLPLVRQWWLITLALFVTQQRPKINLNDIHEFDVKGRDWAWAEKQGLERKDWNMDAHYVKAIRALKECANVWGDPDQYFLKAAVKFASEFDGWVFEHVQSEQRYH